MRISLIVALDENGAIGRQNSLPWHLSTDLKRFRLLTLGHHILMGRRTWESVGRALPGRTSLVITRQPEYIAEGAFIFSTLESALAFAREQGENEIFIIGGAEIFRESLLIADRIYLTRVHTLTPDADVFFPGFNLTDWEILEETSLPADDKNQHPTTFQVLKRKTQVVRKQGNN
jgi:dihydrofolate reductase